MSKLYGLVITFQNIIFGCLLAKLFITTKNHIQLCVAFVDSVHCFSIKCGGMLKKQNLSKSWNRKWDNTNYWWIVLRIPSLESFIGTIPVDLWEMLSMLGYFPKIVRAKSLKIFVCKFSLSLNLICLISLPFFQILLWKSNKKNKWSRPGTGLDPNFCMKLFSFPESKLWDQSVVADICNFSSLPTGQVAWLVILCNPL